MNTYELERIPNHIKAKRTPVYVWSGKLDHCDFFAEYKGKVILVFSSAN